MSELALLGGRPVRTRPFRACFSFQSSQLMTAGEDGTVITSRLECFRAGRASATDRFGRRMVGSNYRITEFQAAIVLGQLERLPELAGRRAGNAKRLTAGLDSIAGIRTLPAQEAITAEAIYNYVFQYRHETVSRDVFATALDAEGIPCDGRFYEPVYRSDQFPWIAGKSPAPRRSGRPIVNRSGCRSSCCWAAMRKWTTSCKRYGR